MGHRGLGQQESAFFLIVSCQGLTGSNTSPNSLKNIGLSPAMMPAVTLSCWKKGLEHVGRGDCGLGLCMISVGREGLVLETREKAKVAFLHPEKLSEALKCWLPKTCGLQLPKS